MGTFTLGTGLGLLASGLVALAIGATVFFVIVNKMEKNKKEEEERKKMERIFN
mgnify:FL=1|tara:strand:+ start:923 stop:1081 length:159 start_codon:yes stop_codon:yes gene_type:complete